MPLPQTIPANQNAPQAIASITERLAKAGAKAPRSPKLKSVVKNQLGAKSALPSAENLKRAVGNQLARDLNPRKGLSHKAYRSTVALTAQQYADLEAKKHAAVAGEMIRNCVQDMSNILSELRTKIDFAEPGELKTVTDTYAAATRELRRALGIIEQTGENKPSALVQVQCVGQVSVSTEPVVQPGECIDLPDVIAEFAPQS